MKKLLFYFTLCFMLYTGAKAQIGQFIPTIIPILTSANKSKYDFSHNKHEGVITLINGQKITGTFEYAYLEFPTYNIKQLSAKNKTEKRYTSKEIKSIVLAGSDTTLSKRDSTYFFKFQDYPNFWRQLSFDENIQVFDWLFDVNERPGLLGPPIMVLKEGQQYIFKKLKILLTGCARMHRIKLIGRRKLQRKISFAN